MRPHRVMIRTVALTALGVLLLLPAGAPANSLLSGYGGPGQGNQAILGSALLKGPSSGGGSGGSSGGGGSAGGLSGGSSETSAGGGASSGRPSAAAPTPRKKHAGDASKSAPAAHTVETLPAASAGVQQGSAALGLSSADALYIILAIGVLAGTGLLTRNLARRPE